MDAKLTRYKVWLCTVLAQLSWNYVFQNPFPIQFTREIYFYKIWKMLVRQQPCFYPQCSYRPQALWHFRYLSVGLVANFISVEQHQTCNFSRSSKSLSFTFSESSAKGKCSSGEEHWLLHQSLEVVRDRCQFWFALIDFIVFTNSTLLMSTSVFLCRCWTGQPTGNLAK